MAQLANDNIENALKSDELPTDGFIPSYMARNYPYFGIKISHIYV